MKIFNKKSKSKTKESKMNQEVETVTINGVLYVKQGSQPVVPTGPRHVVVADRGWIFVGDLTEKDGRIHLDNAVLVQNWSSIGFDGMLNEPKSSNVKLKKLSHTVDLPSDAELFRVPVDSRWGL